VFSLCQIKYNRFVKTVDSTSDGPVEKIPRIEFIKNGTNVDLMGAENVLTFLQSDCGELRMGDSSFLIHTSTSNGLNNKSVLRNGDKACSEPALTDYSFISIELIFDDDIDQTAHKMRLRMGSDNYYVVGNAIDSLFVTYYAHKYLNLENVSRKYTINVVDGDVNCFSVTQDDRIILGKTEYTLSRPQ